MIEASELGVEETTGLQVLATARTIAPTFHDVEDADLRAELVAVLRGVARDAAQRGSLLVKGQRVGPAGVDYTNATSWFSPDVRAALRAICRSAATRASGPVGSFPRPAQVLQNLWPEQYDQ